MDGFETKKIEEMAERVLSNRDFQEDYGKTKKTKCWHYMRTGWGVALVRNQNRVKIEDCAE